MLFLTQQAFLRKMPKGIARETFHVSAQALLQIADDQACCSQLMDVLSCCATAMVPRCCMSRVGNLLAACNLYLKLELKLAAFFTQFLDWEFVLGQHHGLG